MKKFFLFILFLFSPSLFAQEVAPAQQIPTATPLRIVLYSIKDFALLQDMQTKLAAVVQAPVVIARSNADIVELHSNWNGQPNVLEESKKILSPYFRLDASYQAPEAMTLLFRKREEP